MIRLSYSVEGVNIEEIINPQLCPITKQMIDSLQQVYVFERDRTLEGCLAKRYAGLVQRLCLL